MHAVSLTRDSIPNVKPKNAKNWPERCSIRVVKSQSSSNNGKNHGTAQAYYCNEVQGKTKKYWVCSSP